MKLTQGFPAHMERVELTVSDQSEPEEQMKDQSFWFYSRLFGHTVVISYLLISDHVNLRGLVSSRFPIMPFQMEA